MALTKTSFRERLEALRPAGVRPGLDTIRALLAALGNPQDALRCVHVAGTNGKGAVSALVDAVLQAAGYHTARFTSPHLLSVNERFCLDGQPVSDAALAEVADEVFAAVDALAARGLVVSRDAHRPGPLRMAGILLRRNRRREGRHPASGTADGLRRDA